MEITKKDFDRIKEFGKTPILGGSFLEKTHYW
jgi:hypothetical protein